MKMSFYTVSETPRRLEASAVIAHGWKAIGIEAVSRQADPLVWQANEGLIELGLTPMAPLHTKLPTGIIAFQHPRSAEIHAALERENIHVMHHAGRLRLAIHGYNTREDVERLLDSLRRAL